MEEIEVIELLSFDTVEQKESKKYFKPLLNLYGIPMRFLALYLCAVYLFIHSVFLSKTLFLA